MSLAENPGNGQTFACQELTIYVKFCTKWDELHDALAPHVKFYTT